ncbi:unnamed protein product [Urochloa humidicola]
MRCHGHFLPALLLRLSLMGILAILVTYLPVTADYAELPCMNIPGHAPSAQPCDPGFNPTPPCNCPGCNC